jgi:hypothetical protein
MHTAPMFLVSFFIVIMACVARKRRLCYESESESDKKSKRSWIKQPMVRIRVRNMPQRVLFYAITTNYGTPFDGGADDYDYYDDYNDTYTEGERRYKAAHLHQWEWTTPETLESTGLCAICMDEPGSTNHVASPCGHWFACKACASVIEVCPICRTDIRSFIKRCDANPLHVSLLSFDPSQTTVHVQYSCDSNRKYMETIFLWQGDDLRIACKTFGGVPLCPSYLNEYEIMATQYPSLFWSLLYLYDKRTEGKHDDVQLRDKLQQARAWALEE